MNFHIYRIFYLIILFLPATNNYAQNSNYKQYNFRWLTVENGLSNNKVTGISKCKNGFIWIATDDGLNRFDGLTNKYYSIYSGNKELDKWNDQITSIFIDSKGSLWIGAYSLFYYDYDTDSIKAFFSKNNTIQPIRIKALAQSYDNKLWIGARQSLFSIDLNTLKLNYYPFNSKLGNLEIVDIALDGNYIWVASQDKGLFVFDISTRKYTKIPFFNRNKEPINNILSVYAEDNGTIWIGTKDEGLYTYYPYDTKEIHQEKLSPESKRIRDIKGDKFGNLWIGSLDGLYLKAKGSSLISRVAHEEDPISQLSQNSIHNIYFDNHEMMWLGTFSGGVCYTDMHQKQFIRYAAVPNNPGYINSRFISGFAEDKNGNIYVATDSSGINILNSKTGNFTFLPRKYPNMDEKNIRAIAFDSKNNLWIGTYQRGLTLYNSVLKNFRQFTSKEKTKISLQSNTVYSLAIDTKDDIWIGSNIGVDKINHSTGEIENIYTNRGIHYVYIDPKGNIWTGLSNGGVFLFNNKSKKFEPFCEKYNLVSLTTLYRDSQNHLWVGEKSGLACIDLTNYAYYKYTRENGLPNNTIQSILEDDHKNIWITTACGIAKCENAAENPKRFIIKNYYKNDGLQGDFFSKNVAFKSQSGYFYIGGRNGFNKFHPDSIQDNPYMPDLNFAKLKISNIEIEINKVFEGKILLNKALTSKNEINISYKNKSIYVEFIALHYSNPDNITYAYMLYPLEKEWNYTKSPRNFASYYSIPDGEYTFKVKAANRDGIWNNKAIELHIIITPPFWKRKWVSILGTLLFVLLVFFIYNRRIYSIQKQKNNLEKLIEERLLEINRKNMVLKQEQQITEQSQTLNDMEESSK